MLELLLAPFLMGLVEAVPRIVASWVETRNSLRVEYLRSHLNSVAEERRAQTEIRLHEADLAYRAALDYPLGKPGRLRTLLPESGLPCIIVSSVPPEWPIQLDGLADRVHELLVEVEGFTRYATMPSGVFARDRGVLRFIDGEIGARIVAETEFERRPAIVVYFEPGRRSLIANAYLSAVFGTVGGATGFPFTIAQYGMEQSRNNSRPTMRDTDLPSWHYIDLAGVAKIEHIDVMAVTIAWFTLSVLDIYWQLTAGINPGLLARSDARDMLEIKRPQLVNKIASATCMLPGATRLEREATRLTELGYQVTAEELRGGYVGLHLVGPRNVIFVVDASYPELPPAVIRIDGTDVHIDAADWSAECTLTDIVEAVQ